MLNVIMLSVVMLNVIMLSVVAPTIVPLSFHILRLFSLQFCPSAKLKPLIS
jgi:hypothetical protein